jgi:putative oxidoreductase
MNPEGSYFIRGYRRLIAAATACQSVFLLAVRLFWGWQFFLAGKGKLMNPGGTTEFFSGLGIPFPGASALLAGAAECFGGLLLIAGLASRFTALPLLVTMGVAYATAHREELAAIFSDPDQFTGAPPFLFLLAVVMVLLFGPGKLSLDYLLARKFSATVQDARSASGKV